MPKLRFDPTIAVAMALVLLASVRPVFAAGAGPASTFDHLTTGYELTGAHRDVQCESCHVNAMFKGTPRECAACHSRGSLVGATAKPANHVMSTERCGECHTTTAYLPATHFDHAEVRGSCQSCHNNVRATGKPTNHVATGRDCNECHNTTAWRPARFDHASVTGNCVQCHDGVHATGKTATHMPTKESCESCHTPAGWSPVLRVDHTQVGEGCTRSVERVRHQPAPRGSIVKQRSASVPAAYVE